MIARVWKGWTTQDNADPYEALLNTTIFPSFKEIEGFQGASIYREVGVEDPDEVEFVITTYFKSLDSVKNFGGQDDFDQAVIEPEAHALLKRVDSHAKHYEIRAQFSY